VSDDPQRKEFTTRRIEWWVPCHHRDGAYWTDFMKAIHRATNELVEAGELAPGEEPATDQLTVHPHDEHVIVRMEIDEPGHAPDVSQLRVQVDQYREMLASIWLYVDWRYVTKKLTTEQRELWAHAVEWTSEREHPGDGTKADRWWTDTATPTPDTEEDNR
jgi:hypothetical protein